MIKNILVLCYILYAQLVFTQSYPSKTYTVSDGLTYSQITTLYQDSRGYMWIGTKNGLSKFDGKVFENYEKEHLPDTYIADIEEDSKGNIWLGINNGLVKITNDEFEYFPLKFTPNKLTINPDGTIWLLSRLKDGTPNEFYQFDKGELRNMNDKFIELKEKEIYDIHYDDKYSRLLIATRNNGLFIVYEDQLNSIKTSVNKFIRISSDRQKDIYIKSDSTIYSLRENSLEKLYDYPHNTHVIFQNEQDSYYSKGNTVYRVNNASEKVTLLDDISAVNCLLIDKENTLWVGSEEGLIHLLGGVFTHYTKKEYGQLSNIWSIVESKEKDIWLASYGNGLSKISNDGSTIETSKSYTSVYRQKYFYFGAIKDSRSNLLFPTHLNVLKFDGNNFSILSGSDRRIYDENDFDRGVVMYIYEDTTENLFLLGRRGLQVLNTTEEVAFYDSDEHVGLSSYVTSIAKIEKDRYWIGTHAGLALFDMKNESFKTYTSNDSINYLPSKGIISIFQDYKKNWWFGSHNGLLFYDRESDSFTMIDGREVGDNFVHFITDIDTSHLVLGLDIGLALFDLSKFYEYGHIDFTLFNPNNGFLGLECSQNTVLKDSEKNLWVGTPRSVTKIDTDKIKETAQLPPNVFIETIGVPNEQNTYEWEIVNGYRAKESQLEEEIVFPNDQNDLKFTYKAIAFLSPTDIKYKYRLIRNGNGEKWSSPTPEEFAIFTDLRPGTYVFQVMVDDGTESFNGELLASISFRIKYDWSFIFLLILLPLGSVVIYREYFEKRKVKFYQTKVELLRLEAIQAQINPHFIFNIINSIQLHIFSGDKREANTQIIKLSHLIRSFLEASKAETISLSKEIKFLKEYIEFEHNRFNSFSFSLEVAESVKEKEEILLMPPMLFQPFVENAIIHGFQNKNEENRGHLSIEIYERGNDLVCKIVDDGIGIEKAKELKKQLSSIHKSRGTQLVQERIEILKKIKRNNIAITTNSRFNNEKSIEGTEVTIKMNKTFSEV